MADFEIRNRQGRDVVVVLPLTPRAFSWAREAIAQDTPRHGLGYMLDNVSAFDTISSAMREGYSVQDAS
jgi:hypothetical protein